MPSPSGTGESDMSSITASSSVDPKSTSVNCPSLDGPESLRSISTPKQNTTPRANSPDIAVEEPLPADQKGVCPDHLLLFGMLHGHVSLSSASPSASCAGGETTANATPTHSKSLRGSKRIRDGLKDELDELDRQGSGGPYKRRRTLEAPRIPEGLNLKAGMGANTSSHTSGASSPIDQAPLRSIEGSAPATHRESVREKTPTALSASPTGAHVAQGSVE